MEVEVLGGEPMIHPTAIVEDGARIGADTRVWHRCHVRAGSVIGAGCTVGFSVYIDADVVIGDGCKIQNHVSLYRGVTLEDDVFVGPSATFTNDLHPRADAKDWTVVSTLVGRGASIGANATIVCGLKIGPHAMIGAGAVVTSDVAPHALVMGVPARQTGWVCVCGHTLARGGEELPETCPVCGRDTEGVGV
jgi:acetyltransferase-like isoleucine patch superfamily enzyme